MNTTRIAIADDHPLMRAALKEAIAARVKAAVIVEAASVAELIELLGADEPVDAVLLDLKMPDAQGFSALVRVRAQFPEIPVVVISATEEVEAIDRALLLGASGYIVKSAPIETVGRALQDVLDGHIVRPLAHPVDNAFQRAEAEQFRKLRTLTPQQLNVLIMIAGGHSNKTVAQRLQITEGTVKAHITGVLLKLGLQRRTQAAILAQRALQLQGIAQDAEDSTGDDGDDARA
jgi:DNA-binding NarL/FixJ family response regulator